ncbi:MAG: biopolymer transporter ExbB, partial [Pseudomonadota bacterium]
MSVESREVAPQFSRPVRQIILMVLVLGLTAAGSFLALPRVLPVFEANPYLNGFILFVFVIGVLACFWQVVQLMVSVRWIESFAADGSSAGQAPQLMASLASLLRSRGARMQLSASSTRSILDSVATRIDEVREITRYIVNMLIFLGLLGTFYGLATTVPAVVDTIRSLAPQEGEGGVEVFNRLMSGLEMQLGGMGVAFASSLLGLTGSLVVGLLELFAGHGQNRFYRELEDWLSSITRVGLSSGEDGGEQGAFAGVVDHLAEQMEALQLMFTQSDIQRSMVD